MELFCSVVKKEWLQLAWDIWRHHWPQWQEYGEDVQTDAVWLTCVHTSHQSHQNVMVASINNGIFRTSSDRLERLFVATSDGMQLSVSFSAFPITDKQRPNVGKHLGNGWNSLSFFHFLLPLKFPLALFISQQLLAYLHCVVISRRFADHSLS